MSDRPIAILKNRLYVPKDSVTDTDLDAYTYNLRDYASQEDMVVRTYKSFAGNYIGFARGDMGKLESIFGTKCEIRDERSVVPHGYALKFTGELRPEQLKIWEQWRKLGYGLIKAPPRFGKTPLMTYMLTKLRQKAIVLAHESALLVQFEDTVRKFTNINELEEQAGVPLCGQLKNYDDVFPIITFSTWQMLNQEGAVPALKRNKDAFGLMFIDEAHACAAPCFSKIVNNFNTQYRIPVTATDKRKDGFDVVVSDIAGPVVATGTTEQLPVDVSIVWTKHEIKPFGDWNALWSQLVGDEKRNRLIARLVAEDVEAGRSCLVITDRRAHAKELERVLHEEDPYITIDILIGGSPKTSIRDRARSGATQVVIASPKIVQLGWDVPLWSSLHNTLPMANEQNWYQRISRIRTPCASCPGANTPNCMKPNICDKQRPVARIYADPKHQVTYSCLAIMNRVHTKLGFNVKNVSSAPTRAAPDATRSKKWTEVG